MADSLCGIFMNDLIEKYAHMLIQWNKNINLIQANTVDNLYERHIKDCIQIKSFIGFDECIVDIGSGAGLPGVILSICGFQDITLCEKNSKKCIFLREVRSKLGLNFKIEQNDIYNWNVPRGTNKKLVAVSRAFGSLSKIFDVMCHLDIDSGIFLKGENYKNEINEAKKIYNFNYKTHDSITNKKSAIVIVNSLKRLK